MRLTCCNVLLAVAVSLFASLASAQSDVPDVDRDDQLAVKDWSVPYETIRRMIVTISWR